jgi:RNA polymerase sigma-70 factor (ECF subfamily)
MSDAFDVVSDTYLVAWRRLDTLLAADEPQAWLYGVASKTLSNLNRSQYRRESLLNRVVELESHRSDVDPAESVEWSDELVAVLTAMDRLSEYDRELLLMAAYEDLSHTEIALALGTAPVLIRGALFRARRRLERQTRQVAQQRYDVSGHTTIARDNEERSR